MLVILLNATTPATGGPLSILAVFGLTYLVSVGLITYFLYGTSHVLAHLLSFFALNKRAQGVNFRRSYYYATIVGAAPVMLIGLQSIGAVGVQEFILVALFVILGCVYVERITR